MRGVPNAQVTDWVARHPASSLFSTFITEAEIRYGVALLPDGERKDVLERAISGMFEEDLAGQILPFDGTAARAYAEIVVGRRKLGRPISQFDALIAAIARSRGAAVATRNSKDFEACGIDVINPWDA